MLGLLDPQKLLHNFPCIDLGILKVQLTRKVDRTYNNSTVTFFGSGTNLSQVGPESGLDMV
jgi:hypothetical protein